MTVALNRMKIRVAGPSLAEVDAGAAEIRRAPDRVTRSVWW
jgi:hypothetical protein